MPERWESQFIEQVLARRRTAMLKAHRQAHFRVRLLQAAFRIKVEEGQASEEADRMHILTSLTGMPLNSEPPTAHEQRDCVNKLLAAPTVRARRPCEGRCRGG